MQARLLITILAGLTLAVPAMADDMHKGKMAEKFKAADTDNDGTLDRNEVKAIPRMEQHFDMIDTDKDGTISMEEVKKHQKEHHKKGNKMFKEADKNGDKKLDREEAKAMPEVSSNFDAIDADKDGSVERKEIHRYMKNQH